MSAALGNAFTAGTVTEFDCGGVLQCVLALLGMWISFYNEGPCYMHSLVGLHCTTCTECSDNLWNTGVALHRRCYSSKLPVGVPCVLSTVLWDALASCRVHHHTGCRCALLMCQSLVAAARLHHQ